ncbi:MAG TPA: TIGR03936 family radical SAM-associated protein [Thermotogota bacterium]|nr:TIGR03936 family radical SAM-associated protein [Thermotogota bacterium]HPJ88427.1 TIGR03936 family radical SAM-associated protein [Thermotogota bacterium]HPR95406.1 TIGR03936 family radical SAM-associated protein [Thermotogota bacterium]
MIQEIENKGTGIQQGPDYDTYLCQATKTGVLRFLSHREWITAVERTMRRAAFPLWYTQGFHPKPKYTLPRALPTGLISMATYFLVRLEKTASSAGELVNRFNVKSPIGLKMKGMWKVDNKLPLTRLMEWWSFRLIVRDELHDREGVEALMREKSTAGMTIELSKNPFFMIEYEVKEESWLDYRDILQHLYGDKLPKVFYLPVLREVFSTNDSGVRMPLSGKF